MRTLYTEKSMTRMMLKSIFQEKLMLLLTGLKILRFLMEKIRIRLKEM